jgi:anaerobic ribonucleoside-triphosphate reductase activating protein
VKTVRVAATLQDSIVDGIGLRYVVFTQGCPHACPGCHNPATHDPAAGTPRAVAELLRELDSNPLTSGITLSGGEPFAQAAECAELALAARSRGMDVWTYTGFTYERLREDARQDPDVAALLAATDVLVDGPFLLAERTLELPFRGSKNQRILRLPGGEPLVI